MNRIITTFFSLTFSVAAFAQNPASTTLSTNFDEAFTNSGGNPTGWVSANFAALFSGGLAFVSAQNPGYGNSIGSAKITTNNIDTVALLTFNIHLPKIIPSKSGLLLSGKLTGQIIDAGVPYTSKPEGMAYYAKYAPVSTDSAFAYLVLSKWNSAAHKRDTIGLATDTIHSALSAWAKRNMNINYINTVDNPDTLLIIFSSSSRVAPQIGSIFTVDEIMLYPTGTSSIAKIAKSDFSLSPNPASNQLIVNCKPSSTSTIKVMSAIGTVLKTERNLNNINYFDVSELANGIYFLQYIDETNNEIRNRKFEIVR